MSEKTEYPELRKELNRLVDLQQQNQLTNDADKLIVELTSVLQSTPSPALQDAVKEIAFPVKYVDWNGDSVGFVVDDNGSILFTFEKSDFSSIVDNQLGEELAKCTNKLKLKI